MSDRDLIDALSAKIIELEARLGGLDHHVAELRARRRGSMHEDGRCPACGGGELLHVKQGTQVTDMVVGLLGLDHNLSDRHVRTRGTFEYYVCRACRLVETHATALDDLLDNLPKDGDIRVLSAPPDEPPAAGPYR